MTSGPLLAATPPSFNDTILFPNFSDTDSGGLSTQRLYYDPLGGSDADRPTDINLGQYPKQSVRGGRAGVSTGQKSGKSSGSNAASRPSQSKAGVDDPISKMKQLKMLLDAGFITEADYEAKKADILARFF
jgi:hypothetical protein